MPVQFGGDTAWKKFKKGDICVAFHWVNDEPAMVLYPANRLIHKAGAYIIPLESAYQYAHNNGHPDLVYMREATLKAASVMGFHSPDKHLLHRIIDVIVEYIPDLISMPPVPVDMTIEKAVQENVGELSIKVDGETRFETDVPALSAEELMGIAGPSGVMH